MNANSSVLSTLTKGVIIFFLYHNSLLLVIILLLLLHKNLNSFSPTWLDEVSLYTEGEPAEEIIVTDKYYHSQVQNEK